MIPRKYWLDHNRTCAHIILIYLLTSIINDANYQCQHFPFQNGFAAVFVRPWQVAEFIEHLIRLVPHKI